MQAMVVRDAAFAISCFQSQCYPPLASPPFEKLATRFKKVFRWMLHKKRYIWISAIAAFFIFFWYSVPNPLFKDPCSTVLLDKDGELLGAKISTDGQWRFPETEKVPDKFAKAIVNFEDQYYYYHPGFNIVSLCRALYQYIANGRIISGGSTISMQVIRLSRKNKSRTIFEKCIEVFLAARLELTHTKKEILELYASHAPFGSNVVGLDAAAWGILWRERR